MSKMTVHEWLELGVAEGFCTEVACEMHESGSYWTGDEIQAYEDGDDPCIPIVRLWEPEDEPPG